MKKRELGITFYDLLCTVSGPNEIKHPVGKRIVDVLKAITDALNKDLLKSNIRKGNPEEGVMWLMGGQRVQLDSPITELEAVMLINYRQASPEGQAALRSLAAFYATYDQDKS